MDKRCSCGSSRITRTEYGSNVCTACGIEDMSEIYSVESAYFSYQVPLHSAVTYTRLKRFRKYLQRAAMEQSVCSVPETTWKYLLQRTYNGPRDIIRYLKRAPKHIRKKCYDSLPLLTRQLCPNCTIPQLTATDKYRALESFRKLDQAYRFGEPFVSYLYALEYILEFIGRSDVLPFINKIQCRKRRAAYRFRLDGVFKRNRTPS